MFSGQTYSGSGNLCILLGKGRGVSGFGWIRLMFCSGGQVWGGGGVAFWVRFSVGRV